MSDLNKIKHYRILSEISRSACSVVYLAENSGGEQVIIKGFLYDKTSDISKEEQLSRFQRECEIHLFLKHPGVVSALESFEEDSIPYLVLEYKPFPSLRRLIDDKKAISILQSLHIARQLCQAVQYLHEQGIIHRDVKPENILCTPENKIFLTDFGCARKVFAPNITQTKMIQGTLNYMSPEQLMGRDDIDYRTDVFSIGVIIYQLLTFHLPFKGLSPTDIVQNLLYNDPHSLRELNHLVPRSLENLVNQALQKDPDYRTPTARKLEHDLQLLLQQAPIYYSEAHWYMENQNDTDLARKYCQLALKRDPQHLESLQLLGDIYRQQEAWNEAKLFYEKALACSPGIASIYFNLGQIAYQQEDYIQALKMYEKAWVLEPEEKIYELNVAKLLGVMGRINESIEQYHLLVLRYPEWHLPHFELGRLYYQLSQKERALKQFQQANLLDADNRDILYNLAAMEQELGNYQEVVPLYQRILELEPESTEIKHNLANVFYHMGELKESQKLLEEVIKKEDWEISHLVLGFIYTRFNKHSQATESFKRAIACNPNNLVSYFHLASAYREQLRINEAVNTLEYAASQEVGMHHASVYFLLAKAYNDQGRDREVMAALERCLRCPDISPGMADQVKKDISILKSRRRKFLQRRRQTPSKLFERSFEHYVV